MRARFAGRAGGDVSRAVDPRDNGYRTKKQGQHQQGPVKALLKGMPEQQHGEYHAEYPERKNKIIAGKQVKILPEKIKFVVRKRPVKITGHLLEQAFYKKRSNAGQHKNKGQYQNAFGSAHRRFVFSTVYNCTVTIYKYPG